MSSLEKEAQKILEGWYTNNSTKAKFDNLSDPVVVLLHFTLLAHSPFTFESSEGDTAGPPKSWKLAGGMYSLQYDSPSGKKLSIKIVEMGKLLVFNCQLGEEEAVTTFNVSPSEFFSSSHLETPTSLFSSIGPLVSLFDEKLLSILFPKTQPSKAPAPIPAPDVNPYLLPPTPSPLSTPSPSSLYNVGHDDLDPLGGRGGMGMGGMGMGGMGMGGGMGGMGMGGMGMGGSLVGPDHPMFFRNGGRGNLNAVPPGARFDPYGPPQPHPQPQPRPRPPTNSFSDPSPDHLPPPGMYDNLYM